MEGEEEGGIRLSKRLGSGEVDYKTKSGTAWSHSFLNQKPWHPLSYPNQRRKWIAEQTHAQRERRAEEVSREYKQEQDFFRQTALISKREKEKVEMMQAVSFMYVRPPGYNPESAKEAEIADERKNLPSSTDGTSTATPLPESGPSSSRTEEKKKPRPKDVFGRALPTEEEFEVLKNAPRLETGVAGRAKPFGVEVRNVKCLRCGNFGHQSGDRECPLKDAIMPNEENRLKRDDPLNAIIAQVDPSEPLKWELKQRPGISPPRGGFKPDDPNQQIVAEDIFDEYGGFLTGGVIPELFTNFSSSKPGKKSRTKKKLKKHSHSRKRELKSSEEDELSAPLSDEKRRSFKDRTQKEKKQNRKNYSESSSSDEPGLERHHSRVRQRHYHSAKDSKSDRHHKQNCDKNSHLAKHFDSDCQKGKKSRRKQSYSSESEDSDSNGRHGTQKNKQKQSYSSEDSHSNRHHGSTRSRQRHNYSHQSDYSELDGRHRTEHHHPRHHHDRYHRFDSFSK
ncbi:putative cir [Tripterygium wilfordii]|uniref:Putative cir n=1 Tax=Tripterygium wilfordii TaxID=458696 RepID=A0A7J7E221_TRIWF|nr:uncharacterized zinc finger CCHC domain-containing protein At4g19190 [Tripterygium wilfordii]KAF5752581.1 putative cir [Tripterygium wilfordii]